jgi:sugar phosphate isomerase/epimerase
MKDRNGVRHSPSRRDVIAAGAVLLTGTAADARLAAAPSRDTKLKVSVFSKHLQFLPVDQLPAAVAEMGFDGIDLTVRKGGHVEPARVQQDLGPAVSAIRKHGLEVAMVTTDIVDAQTPHAEDVIRNMSELGIKKYRWGGFVYAKEIPIAKQLQALKPRVAKLAALNAQAGVCAMYHTHSGVGLVGAPIWDLHEILKDFDPNSVSVNYDVGHATIEGGLGGWIDSFQITDKYLRGVAVKDFLWEKEPKGNWTAQWTPLGRGMVRFPQFFEMLAHTDFAGPLQLHFEYPLGGADAGKREISIDRTEVYAAMKRDLAQLRGYMKAASLA